MGVGETITIIGILILLKYIVKRSFAYLDYRLMNRNYETNEEI